MLRRTKPKFTSLVNSALLSEKALYFTRKEFKLNKTLLHTLMLIYEIQQVNNSLVTASGLRPWCIVNHNSITRTVKELLSREYIEEVKTLYNREDRNNTRINIYYNLNQKGLNVINYFIDRSHKEHVKFNDKFKFHPIKKDKLKYYDSLGIMYKKHNIKK